MSRGPLKLFISYAHEDAEVRRQLSEHLDLLVRQDVVAVWHDAAIVPGSEWREAIEENLRAADIVLLLVSKAFIASAFVREVEIPMAMAAHDEGGTTVLPVLVESIGDLREQRFARLEVLPSEARPLADWEDRARGLADVAEGVRAAATAIVWARGGPFEFGCHRFTEAELASLEVAERTRAMEGLDRLAVLLTDAVPARRVDENVLVASWCLREFGKRPRDLAEADHYIAQIVSAFDVVALQEVKGNLDRMSRVLEILGPDWGHLVSDVSPGRLGNDERVAIVYYRPRAGFQNVVGEVVLTPKELEAHARLGRKPLLASFRAGALDFWLCSAHLCWGRDGSLRLPEVRSLTGHLSRKAKRERLNYIVAGDFGTGPLDGECVTEFRNAGFEVPDHMLRPTNVKRDKLYDFFAFRFDRDPVSFADPKVRSGALEWSEAVLRDTDQSDFEDVLAERQVGWNLWRSHQISDHLPIWVEIDLGRLGVPPGPVAGS